MPRLPAASGAGVILSALNAHGLGVQRTGPEADLGIPRRGRDSSHPAAAAGRRSAARRDHQRQIMVRRAVGVGIVVLLLILIVLGIRGCLNARKERSFENYVSDLNAIAAQSNQLSERLLQPPQRPGQPQPAQLRGGDQGRSRNRGEPGEPGRRPRHPGRVEERPERAQPRLPAAQRRLHRDLRPRSPRRSATRAAPRPSTRSPATCSTSWPATSSTSRPRRRSTPSSRTRESTRRRPTASSCRLHRLARPAQGLIRARPGLRRQAGDAAAPTAWRSTRPP